MKWYVASVIVVGLLTWILQYFPILPMLGLVALVLPGLILLSLPTLFPYLLSIGPSVFAYDLTGSLKLALPLGLIGVAAVAFGLPEFARISFERVADRYRRSDFGAVPVEIRPVIVISAEPTFFRSTACVALCQKLLRIPGVDAVYMTNGDTTEVHRLRHTNFSLTESAPSGGTRRYPVNRCFSSEAADLPTSPALTIKPRHLTRDENKILPPTWPARLMTAVRVNFEGARSAEQTYVEAILPSKPFYMDYRIGAGTLIGWSPADWSTPKWEDLVVRDLASGADLNER